MPALFTSTSMLPCSATPAATTRRTSSSLETSPVTAVTLRPKPRQASATAVEQLGAAGGQHEVAPGLGQGEGELLAQAVRGTGDQRGLPRDGEDVGTQPWW